MVEKVCSVCGKPITIALGDYPYKMCPECREKHRAKGRARYQARKKLKRHGNDKITALTAEIEEYNKKHGTRLTYGKYVAMKEIEAKSHDD